MPSRFHVDFALRSVPRGAFHSPVSMSDRRDQLASAGWFHEPNFQAEPATSVSNHDKLDAITCGVFAEASHPVTEAVC